MSESPQTATTAVLLITVRFEPGSPEPRARVIRTVDVRTPGETMMVVGRDAILEAVHGWLYARADDRPPPPPGLA